jgi:hypothetical protein
VLGPNVSGLGTGVPVPSNVTLKSSAENPKVGTARARQKNATIVKLLIPSNFFALNFLSFIFIDLLLNK